MNTTTHPWVHRFLVPAFSAAILTSAVQQASAEWSTQARDGAIHAHHAGEPQLIWQLDTLQGKHRSESFLPSAFLHPLRTPAGFVWTAALPSDHVHHLGLWWPWKHIEVDGEQYNCWELQDGQGAHHAVSAKFIHVGPDALEWEFHNEIRIRKAGEDAGPPVTDGVPAIHETVRARFARHGDDANVIDLVIRHVAVDQPVTIGQYRYSGFSWRGPEAWDKTNSEMTTCEAHTRDEANGTESRWVLVTGPGEGEATASVLMMSAAADIAGKPETLRVWNSGAHQGTPFVNFNPVQREALPLDAEHPAVSHRQYRIIAADRTLTAAEAEAEWTAWREEATSE